MIVKWKMIKWKYIVAFALITGAIPIVITAYELIATDKDSVVFLENFPPGLDLLVFAYYVLLFIWGIVWLVRKLIAFVKLKNETKKNELRHLQSQVNPHFFFNMLNNLYGLVDKDTAKAKQLILKLSDMMRYSIYDGQKEAVTIAEEVDYLKNYIELHRMRYRKDIEIKFKKNIADEQLKVMPLMFIILLENAFKHGVEQLRAKAYVHIELNSNRNSLYFSVENNFDPEEINKQKGMGLTNLKRRLDLVYPEKYSLSVAKNKSVHKAELILNKIDR